MFVKIVQKWNAFKQNWAEYQRLRRVAARAWHKLDGLRAKVTVMYRANEPQPKNHCIATKILEVRTMAATDDVFNTKTPLMMMVDHYCPHFNGNAKSVRPCNEVTCPRYTENCEYAAASQEYETAVAQKRTFWDRVKTKTK